MTCLSSTKSNIEHIFRKLLILDVSPEMVHIITWRKCSQSFGYCYANHRDYIKLEGSWGAKIGMKLNAVILNKLGASCSSPGPFPSVWALRGQTTEVLRMASSVYTSAEYNLQNALRNLVCTLNRSSCLSIRFGNSMFAWKWKIPQSIPVVSFGWRNKGNQHSGKELLCY